MFEIFYQKDIKKLNTIHTEIMKLSLLMFQDTNRFWELKETERVMLNDLELSEEKYNSYGKEG